MGSSVKLTEYTLSTPYDISSASFSKDGSTLYIYDEVDSEKEEAIRNKYPDVKRLYEEYRVALILSGGEML